MEILVLGGTGAMGQPLVQLLKKAGHEVYVTTRRKIPDDKNLHYLHGNAKDDTFLAELLEKKYDAIVDFMVYGTEELKKRLPALLSHTKQYIFFSSSRVYAASNAPLTELSPRLLDTCKDATYLRTDEYALAKAREEDLLINSNSSNWTVIRPYITYNDQRLQLGVYEKENWLYRALQGRTIVMPSDIAARKIALTYGPDVAAKVAALIGNEKALGQVFQIVNPETTTWGDILQFYLEIIENKTGKRPKVRLVDNSFELQTVWNPWQIRYDRLFDRSFDSSKVNLICRGYHYKSMRDGLQECLERFLDHPKWLGINWRYEAWADKITGEHTPIREIDGLRTKVRYLKYRYFQE